MFYNESKKNTCPVEIELNEELVFNYNTKPYTIVFIINLFIFVIQYIYYNYIKNILLILFIILVELLVIMFFWIIAYVLVLKNIPIIKSIIDSS